MGNMNIDITTGPKYEYSYNLANIRENWAQNKKVLVKCRQNVANKLFITRVFNPVHPRTATKCSTDYSGY